MLSARRCSAREYYESEDDEGEIEVYEFRAPGPVIVQRLDLLGVTEVAARAALDYALSPQGGVSDDPDFMAKIDDELRRSITEERTFRAGVNADRWIDLMRETAGDPYIRTDAMRPGSLAWLLSQLDYWDERFALRVVLLALPEAEVVLDVTELEEGGWLEGEPGALASNALEGIRIGAAAHAPTVVLTEGRTHAEFLSVALEILYPHLSDLIRFLDYEGKPEGGVGALVRLVRSFAAAGIANKVIALFDNDAAAADALRNLEAVQLPANIQVLQYPEIALATDYPTLGPPNSEAPGGTLTNANVNGLAGSIELYLGRDVLSLPGGELRPVQWTSFIQGVKSYQGEVTGKREIHEAFRRKYLNARRGNAVWEDWAELQAIIDIVTCAFASWNSWPGP